MPNVDKTCTTHHHACDCREALIRELIKESKGLITMLRIVNAAMIGDELTNEDKFVFETCNRVEKIITSLEK